MKEKASAKPPVLRWYPVLLQFHQHVQQLIPNTRTEYLEGYRQSMKMKAYLF